MPSAAVRLLNATSTGERLTFDDPVDDFAQFDRFPPALRWRIAENNTKASCAAVAQHFAWAQRNGFGASRTIGKINEIERNEIAVFAGQYRAQVGVPYPHTAAEASIQRYGALGPSRHPPKRYGKPVVWPRKRGRRRHVG